MSPIQQTSLRDLLLFSVVLVAALGMQPSCRALLNRLRPRWRRLHTVRVLAAVCVIFSVALIHIGRHQFGAFDFNAMLEVGWRQVLGQRMYVDFLTPTPPGFNLGIYYAMSVFGPCWDANLYLNAIFGCVTLVWIYGLLRQLELGRPVALLTAIAIEGETVLLLSFWWYNDTTLVLAAVFLLNCLAYVKRPSSSWLATSYVASFALLAIMKPNIAGLALAGGLLLLFFASADRARVALLTCAALALVALVFAANHISVSAMVATYRAVARERGGLSLYGLHQMEKGPRMIAVVAFAFLSLPCLWLVPRLRQALRKRQSPRVAQLLFVLLAFLVSVYGLMSNGEFWQVECAPLLAVLMASVFSLHRDSYKSWFRHLLLAVLCADIASNLYLGIVRLRVLTIGSGMFFEWTDNEHIIADGPLRHMRVSGTMIEVQRQVQSAVQANPGPYYFGPRLDYNYFALDFPSPSNRPAWWDPGTSFGREQEPSLIALWKDQSFKTLIFLKGDYTRYSPAFMQAIEQHYIRDDNYPRLTVYHRR